MPEQKIRVATMQELVSAQAAASAAALEIFIISKAAQVAHEVNRTYCALIGDNSQVSWEETPDNIKASAIDGVTKIFTGEISSPQESHENWSKFKIADGWVYGEVKDMEKKTHPSLVDYDQLTEAEKAKDYLFFAVALSMFDRT